MARVGVLLAWQSFRNDMRDPVGRETGCDRIANRAVGWLLVIRDHMLVERAEDDQYVVAAIAQETDGTLERPPLERRVWLHPAEMLRLRTTSVPWPVPRA